MASKSETVMYSKILSEINKNNFRKIYVLMGTESYYIDDLEEKITNSALSPDERDFNLTIFYGMDTDAKDVISACKRYPVMSSRQVVVLREAQSVNNPDMFKFYAQSPLESTILIICCKNGDFKATGFLKLLQSENTGVVFKSDKLREKDVPKAIEDFVLEHGCRIDSKACSMLKDYVGTDVSRLVNEVGKLTILISVGDTITPELIERNIGISKDYNNFELGDAIRTKNYVKASAIVEYFAKNPKRNPTIVTVSYLFSFFANLLLANTNRDKSEQGIINATSLDRRQVWVYSDAMRYYNTADCVNIIGFIRDFDRKAKGMQSRQNEYALLKELIFKIIFCR